MNKNVFGSLPESFESSMRVNIGRWKQQFLENAPQLFQRGQTNDQADTRIAELEQVVGRLTVELEIAKKASLCLGRAERRNVR